MSKHGYKRIPFRKFIIDKYIGKQSQGIIFLYSFILRNIKALNIHIDDVRCMRYLNSNDQTQTQYHYLMEYFNHIELFNFLQLCHDNIVELNKGSYDFHLAIFLKDGSRILYDYVNKYQHPFIHHKVVSPPGQCIRNDFNFRLGEDQREFPKPRCERHNPLASIRTDNPPTIEGKGW